MSFDVNFLAVIGATVATYAVGALWYGPLFGKTWKQEMGFTDEAMKGMKMTVTGALSGGFVSTLVLVFVLANFLPVPPALTVGTALTRAFLIWLGFVATILTNAVWYENRSWKLYFINAAHYLVALFVAAAVLAVWPW